MSWRGCMWRGCMRWYGGSVRERRISDICRLRPSPMFRTPPARGTGPLSAMEFSLRLAGPQSFRRSTYALPSSKIMSVVCMRCLGAASDGCLVQDKLWHMVLNLRCRTAAPPDTEYDGSRRVFLYTIRCIGNMDEQVRRSQLALDRLLLSLHHLIEVIRVWSPYSRAFLFGIIYPK